jgi:hypothetical protein
VTSLESSPSNRRRVVAICVSIRASVLIRISVSIFEGEGVLPIRIHNIFRLEQLEEFRHSPLLLPPVFGLARESLISQRPQMSSIILTRHVALPGLGSCKNKGPISIFQILEFPPDRVSTRVETRREIRNQCPSPELSNRIRATRPCLFAKTRRRISSRDREGAGYYG